AKRTASGWLAPRRAAFLMATTLPKCEPLCVMMLMPWVVANAAATLLNALTLGFLGYRDDSAPLKRWGLGWGFVTVAVLVSGLVDWSNPVSLTLAVAIGADISGSLAFLDGSYK